MKNIRIEIKWAIIFVVAQLLWMLGEKLTGLHSTHIDKHAIYTNFFGIIAIVIYVLALLDKRKNFYNGVMTYQQGFIAGLIITAIITVLTPLVQYVISTVITPEYFPNVIKYTVDSGAMNQEAAEKFFNLQSYMIQATIGAAIMGVITTAIVAIFTRKKA